MNLDLIETEIYEERSAICQFDGLLTREEAEKQGKLASEEWREACEVRYICDMPTRKARVEYLSGVEKKRGQAAANRLKGLVMKVWNKMNNALADAGREAG